MAWNTSLLFGDRPADPTDTVTEDVMRRGMLVSDVYEDWEGPPSGPSIWESLSEGLSVAGKGYAQWLKLDAQAESNKLNAELARMRIQQGMSGGVGPAMGGLNWLTILAFGGVGILIVLMLRS